MTKLPFNRLVRVYVPKRYSALSSTKDNTVVRVTVWALLAARATICVLFTSRTAQPYSVVDSLVSVTRRKLGYD